MIRRMLPVNMKIVADGCSVSDSSNFVPVVSKKVFLNDLWWAKPMCLEIEREKLGE